jgi:hypothetical protein
MGFLRGRTPLQAAEACDAQVALRAAVCRLETSREPWRPGFDFRALRDRLRIPDEPAIEPENADLDTIHLARLGRVAADRLSDARLVTLYRLARQYGLDEVLESAALALSGRPAVFEAQGVEPLAVFSDLASLASANGRQAEAMDWIGRGRRADPAAKRPVHAPQWDMLELRLKAPTERPETWVPELAVVVERYRNDPDATQIVMMNLIDMGLLEMVSHPERPGEVLLDSRPLQALMAQYGPRVTTAGGRLGVSATKPEIWTPGGTAGPSGGIWTPGATTGSPAPGGGPGEKKGIIISGR